MEERSEHTGMNSEGDVHRDYVQIVAEHRN